jgi:hypothetical protein
VNKNEVEVVTPVYYDHDYDYDYDYDYAHYRHCPPHWRPF